MKRAMVSVVVACASLGLVCQAFSNSARRTDDPLGVAVSPQTLLLNQVQGGRVTVHTSIPSGSVDRATLELNGVPVSSVGADSLGHLVAHFDEAAIKAIVAPPETGLTLTGIYTDGEAFSGSDTVRVVEKKVATACAALAFAGEHAGAALLMSIRVGMDAASNRQGENGGFRVRPERGTHNASPRPRNQCLWRQCKRLNRWREYERSVSTGG